ncbi:MAG: HNH endonuclease [Halarcobacter sp.]
MIIVVKDFNNIPIVLKNDKREEAFNANIKAHDYVDDKNRYKVGSVQKKLNEIYHLKCAFCEQKLLDSPKHIEHYRPKSVYYWLSYSWDNLLLACGSCNSFKGDRFKILDDQVVYNNETFENIHRLGATYDISEKPLIINCEKDDVLDDIRYTNKAKVFSTNERVKHTIEEACKLNRNELLEKRLPLLNDFINIINKHYTLYKKHGDLTRFKPDIEQFIEKCNKESEFYSFRYYILKNIDVFFDNENIQKILKAIILKLDRVMVN